MLTLKVLKCEVLTRQQIHASWTWRSHFRMTFWTMPWSSHSSKSLLELSLIVKSRPDGQSYCVNSVNQTSVSMSMVLTYCSQMLYEVAECFECCFAWVVFKSFCSSHFITRRYTVPQELSMSSKSLHLTTHWRLLKYHPTIRYTVQSVSPVQHHAKLLVEASLPSDLHGIPASVLPQDAAPLLFWHPASTASDTNQRYACYALHASFFWP